MLNTGNIKGFHLGYSAVCDKVYAITDTEHTERLDKDNYKLSVNNKYLSPDSYSKFGLQSFGRAVKIPYDYVDRIKERNPVLATEIMEDGLDWHFERKENPLYMREFGDKQKVHGVVSDRYSYFDDNEVMEVLGKTDIKNLNFANSIITPERLHLRALEDTPFHIEGDTSNLFFSYFIDNSMVGMSSFRVQLGIYRQVCSNGLIVGMSDFTLLRQIHKRTDKKYNQIAAEFNEAIRLITDKRQEIVDRMIEMTKEKSSVSHLNEDERKAYLSRKLNLSAAESLRLLGIYETYVLEFGGHTKWALANAITEFARDIPNIDRREGLERYALKVA